MSCSSLFWHGGAVDVAAQLFGREADWLDLSTGIAPVPYPVPPLAPEVWTRLPLARWGEAFVAVVRATHGVDPQAGIVPVAGEQAALQTLPFCQAPPGPVVVPAPGYGGHAEAWAGAGRTIEAVADPVSRAGQGGVVVVINPNNPTGQTWDPARILAAAERQARAGGWLVVDEAFAEVTPEVSVVSHAGRPGLVVLRSFGKFFGLPGARLGWVAADPAISAALGQRLGPWAVSGPALAVGTRAEADQRWRQRQRLRLQRRAARLDAILADAGLTVIGGTSLFRTVRHPDAGQVFERLGRAGILVRAFRDPADLLRFGLPPTPADEKRLRRALS
ncbi:threonine-phosphate decarboxylase CobD [Pararhodospirillum photometricum]|uniref:threonine-phosphate decarboxylase n=1 Tax=Pararhodospirillum photometricum DSM 122 TaxID=1150469 RepID=H6SL02_PARPM|nr:threonine-phosphate decarboxylase CobD [Pararhodospirillum photometricum]CCG08667.1 Aminotransferase [Pararhodospirillum photometricum DSM 122]